MRSALAKFGEVTDLIVRKGKVGAYAFATMGNLSAAESAVAASPLSVGTDSCQVEFRRSKPRAAGSADKGNNTTKKKKKKRRRKVGETGLP